MLSHLIDKIADEIWGKKGSIWCAVAIFLLIGVASTSNIYYQMSYIDSSTGKVLTQNGIIVLLVTYGALLSLLIWYIWFVCKNYYIRKAKRGKVGIIVFYDTASRTVYKDTVRKLGDVFRTKINADFDVIDVPYGLTKDSIKNKDSIIRFLNKKNSILLLNVIVNTDEEENILTYDLRIDGAIIHPTYKENVEKEFQKVFANTTRRFKENEFSSKDMTKKLRITAEEMSIGCEYIIGLSYFLNGQLNESEKIYAGLLRKLYSTQVTPQMLESVKHILYEINMCFVGACFERYQFNCDNDESIMRADAYLDKANKYCEGTFDYYINKAYCLVAKDGDVKKAAEYINICKQMKNAPQIWKYSDAFIKAYENKSIISICSAYRAALRIPYNINDLTVFIESVLKRKNEKTGLYLALGILYNEVKEETLAKENINKYIDRVDNPDSAMRILINKGICNRTC